MRRPRRRPRPKPNRPPFENRFGSGEQGWHWYEELEYLGPDYVRIRIAQQEALADVSGLEPFDVPLGYAHDWLVYRDRRDRRQRDRWRVAVLILALIAAIAAVVAATPVIRSWS